MNTHAGYSKKTLTDTNVLLAGGGDKSLADFLGGIQYVSASHKIQYRAADTNTWTDLVTLVMTDENVKQTPKTDNVNRPLMMINGSTSTGTLTSTSMFSTGIYANTSTKMITASGFIKTGSDNVHVLLGGGGHALAGHSNNDSPYIPIADGTVCDTLNANMLEGYYSNNIYQAATYIINNGYTSNTWIRIATITIPGTNLSTAGFTAIFSNRECLDNTSFILTLGIRRDNTTSAANVSFYYTALQGSVPRTISLRSNDNQTFYVYFQSAANSWTTYYNVTKIMTEGNITYENVGTTSPTAGTLTNKDALKGGNVNWADIATKLATTRTISLIGNATGSTTFDGSADVSISVLINNMTGATDSTDGTAGFVPAPPSDGYDTKFLKADGTWSVPAYPTKASWNYDDRYVSSLEIHNDYLRWIKNGTANDLTIPYATKAAQDSNGRSLVTYKEYSGTFPPNDGTLQWYTILTYTNGYYSKSAIIEINTRRGTATILILFYNTTTPFITILGYYGSPSATYGGFTGGIRIINDGGVKILFLFYTPTSTSSSYRQLGVKVYSENPEKWEFVDSLVADTNTYDSFLANVKATSKHFTGGGLMPIADNTYDIGSSIFKYKNVYATTFHGELDGNAASATKLHTARTIWGLSFDGTAKVSGTLYVIDPNNSNVQDSAKIKFHNFADNETTVYNAPYIQGIAISGSATYGRKRLGFFTTNATTYDTGWIEALSILPTGNIGIGIISPSYKLDVDGNVRATNFYTTSDRNKKENISEFSEHIRKFQLKDTEKWYYGVIAQEIEEIFRDGEEGNMTVNYNSVLSYYIGQLENRVKELEDKLKKYEELLIKKD